jgi:hypothetical protein
MTKTTLRKQIFSAVSGLLLAGSVWAGNGALLGVTTGYPLINFVAATVPQGAVYSGSTLTITGTPVFTTFTPSGSPEFISSGTLTISASINAAGTFSGGTFTIGGTVIDTKGTVSTGDDVTYTGTLLSGTVLDYGIADTGGPGGTDLADFAMKATGGSMLTIMGGANAPIGASVTLEGSTFAGSFASNWSATTTKGDVGPNITTKPFPCYNVSTVVVKNRSGTTNDEVHIQGGVRLDAGDTFDPATQDVTVTIDGLVISLPAGSFTQVGTSEVYKYSTATGVYPKISMRLDFEKSRWTFDLTKGDVSLIDTSDGVTVTLQVGDYEGTSTSPISHGGNSSSSHHSGHAPSCKLSGPSSDSASPGWGKRSSINSLTLKTPSNVFVKKSQSMGNVKHPTTPVVDNHTGEIANVNTSGGACLRCGDVVTGNQGGSFTIMQIRGRPGDALSRACGISNATCSILPPGY